MIGDVEGRRATPPVFLEEAGYGKCVKCKTSKAASERGLCYGCAHVEDHKGDVADVSIRQVAKAVQLLRPVKQAMRWPWPSVDELTGPLLPGHVTYICANSGSGKTTVSYNLVLAWLAQGLGISVLPLETRPNEWRMGLAAIECGIGTSDMWELPLLAPHDPHQASRLALLEQTLALQALEPMVKQLVTVADEGVGVSGLNKAMAMAGALGHHVVIVDHVDQLQTERDPISGRQEHGIVASVQVQDALLMFAKRHMVHVIAFSQSNMGVGSAHNRLLQYRPLSREHVFMPSKKVQNSTNMLGLFRPIRKGVDRDMLAAARDGRMDPHDVLAPDRIGINVMKSRFRGQNDGRKLELHFDRGRIRELTAAEREQDRGLETIHGKVSHDMDAGPAPRRR